MRQREKITSLLLRRQGVFKFAVEVFIVRGGSRVSDNRDQCRNEIPIDALRRFLELRKQLTRTRLTSFVLRHGAERADQIAAQLAFQLALTLPDRPTKAVHHRRKKLAQVVFKSPALLVVENPVQMVAGTDYHGPNVEIVFIA